MIGFAMCGSFCTLGHGIEQMGYISNLGKDIMPIMSDTVYYTDTRFGSAKQWRDKCKEICQREIIHTIKDAEPLGPKYKLEYMVICPCTGNTLAKIANGITDTPVCMAAKAHMRQDRPLVIALASNDAMSANLKNIALLLQRKNVFFVPLKQDDPENKPHSLVCDFSLLRYTVDQALIGKQIRKLFI